MSNEIAIIITLSLIIFSSPLISKLIKIPVIPIEIFLGSVAVSFAFIQENHIFTLVAELGFLYLMFLAGLEVDLKKLLKISPELLKKGLLYSFLLYAFATIFTWSFSLSNIFIVTLPLISIGLLAVIKKEYGDSPWLDLAFTVGLIGEIISIVVLAAVSAGLEYGMGAKFYENLISLGVVFVVMIALYYFFNNLIWWYPELKTYLMPKNDNQEQDIRFSMSIFFLMIAVMLYLHLEVVLGAFIAGVFITTFFEHNKELPHKLEHFGFGWLVPIFFVWIGTSFELKSLFLPNLITTALLITFGMILIRFLSSLIFIKSISFKGTTLMALSHSMPLTLIIAVATLAVHNNSISQFYYYAFILSAIFEVIICMILIRLINKKEEKKVKYGQ
ncbi:cation:proton antiporter [Arcobacter sp. 15-2]|uniref:cation:proton antiporter n=1 Tax=Arcobacter sp. 15-2 TaxID=3374109 RepID=UPI00399D2BB9